MMETNDYDDMQDAGELFPVDETSFFDCFKDMDDTAFGGETVDVGDDVGQLISPHDSSDDQQQEQSSMSEGSSSRINKRSNNQNSFDLRSKKKKVKFPQLPPTLNSKGDVCFGLIKHAPNQLWRDYVKKFSDDVQTYPRWEDSISDQVQQLLQEDEINRFLVPHNDSDTWRLATAVEILERTKQRFRDDRKMNHKKTAPSKTVGPAVLTVASHNDQGTSLEQNDTYDQVTKRPQIANDDDDGSSSTSDDKDIDRKRPPSAREAVYPITRMSVCFQWHNHPGTIEWREMIRTIAYNKGRYPTWKDNIVKQVTEKLAEKHDTHIRYLVFCHAQQGRHCLSIHDGLWYDATDEEIVKNTEQQFLFERRHLERLSEEQKHQDKPSSNGYPPPHNDNSKDYDDSGNHGDPGNHGNPGNQKESPSRQSSSSHKNQETPCGSHYFSASEYEYSSFAQSVFLFDPVDDSFENIAPYQIAVAADQGDINIDFTSESSLSDSSGESKSSVDSDSRLDSKEIGSLKTTLHFSHGMIEDARKDVLQSEKPSLVRNATTGVAPNHQCHGSATDTGCSKGDDDDDVCEDDSLLTLDSAPNDVCSTTVKQGAKQSKAVLKILTPTVVESHAALLNHVHSHHHHKTRHSNGCSSHSSSKSNHGDIRYDDNYDDDNSNDESNLVSAIFRTVPIEPKPNDVCFKSIRHPGTKKWRDTVRLISSKTNDFPVWHDDIVKLIKQHLRIQHNISRFLVSLDANGDPSRKISEGKWYLATEAEIFSRTKAIFVENRNARQKQSSVPPQLPPACALPPLQQSTNTTVDVATKIEIKLAELLSRRDDAHCNGRDVLAYIRGSADKESTSHTATTGTMMDFTFEITR